MELKEFGLYFSELREKSGFRSQRELADKSGVSHSTINRIEAGTHKTSPEILMQLAPFLRNTTYKALMEKMGYLSNEYSNIENNQQDNYSSLGSRLRTEREKKGWSQIFVASEIGITNSVLSNYERDYRDPDTETLGKLAELYGVSTDYLLGKSEISGTINQQDIFIDPDIQIIARAKKDMSPKDFQKVMELARKAIEMFENEDKKD